jgi:hypothetical protein
MSAHTDSRLCDIELWSQIRLSKSQFTNRPVAEKSSCFNFYWLLSRLKYLFRVIKKNISHSISKFIYIIALRLFSVIFKYISPLYPSYNNMMKGTWSINAE